jgi:hypothetical protein
MHRKNYAVFGSGATKASWVRWPLGGCGSSDSAKNAGSGGTIASGDTTSCGGTTSSGGTAGSGGTTGSGRAATRGQGGATGSGGARGAAPGERGNNSTGGTAGSVGPTGTGGLGGSTGSGGSGGSAPTFAAVSSILGMNWGTGTCHDGTAHVNLHNDAGLYARIVNGSPNGTKTMTTCKGAKTDVPDDVKNSAIARVIMGALKGCTGGRMPDDCPTKRGCPTAQQISSITDWISAGALM